MTASPNKRTLLLPSDPTTIRLPESPEKRSIRRLQSHQQLSSSSRHSSTKSNTLGMRQSQERLGQNPTATTTNTNIKPSAQSTTIPSITTTTASRQRSNSDLPMPITHPQRNMRKPSHPPISNVFTTQTSTSHARKTSLEMTLRDGPTPGNPVSSSLNSLRQSTLTSGVTATKEGMSDYRVYLWLTLLNVPPLSTDTYLNQIHRGRSPQYAKISNDVFRTLATDTLFKRRVTDASMTRLLNATAWRITDTHKLLPSDSPTLQSPYLQGINVLCAPLLYASRSEAQAYALLTTLLTHHIPTYLTPTMSGVHAGVELIDKILSVISPSLSQFLLQSSLPAKIYAFASVLTLCACTPPLPEVLKLWDFLFAFGPHLNILCIVAQLILLKDKLMSSPSPGKMLRSLPNLESEKVIKMTLVIVRELPEDIYAEVVRHARF